MKISRSKGGIILVVAVSLMISSMGFSQQQLTGVVTYGGIEELPMSGVTVGLFDLQDSLILSTNTNEKGIYFIDSIPSGQYYVKSTHAAEVTNVHIDDAYLLLMNLLGQYQLNDIQNQLADVDNSNSVTWNDYFILLIDYLLHGESFPAGDWKSDIQYLDYTSRAAPEQDTVIIWVSESADIEMGGGMGGRSSTSLLSDYREIDVSGKEFSIDIGTSYADAVNSFNLNFVFPVHKFEVTNVIGPDDHFRYTVDNETGELKMVWINQSNDLLHSVSGKELIRVYVKSKLNNITGESLHLMDGGMVLDASGRKIDNITIEIPVFKHSQKVEEKLSTATIYPNPFKDRLSLQISVVEDDHASVSFYDLQGRLVKKMDNFILSKGINQLDVQTTEFMPGHYFYTVDFGKNIHQRFYGRCYRSSQ